MKSKNLLIALVFLLVVIPSPFAYAVTLQNPGFENWTNGMPDGWNVYDTGVPSGGYSISECDTTVNEGQKSVKISFDSYPMVGTFDINTYIYQAASGVSAGQAYAFDVRKMCQTGSGMFPFYRLYMTAGIDPYGGTDPLSNAIVWGDSQEYDAYNNDSNFIPLSAETIAQNPQITVFVKNNIEGWTSEHFGTVHWISHFWTNSYIDSAELNLIPEPTTLLLMGFGSLFLGLRKRL